MTAKRIDVIRLHLSRVHNLHASLIFAEVKAIELQSSSPEPDYMALVIAQVTLRRVIEICSDFVKMLGVLMIAKHLRTIAFSHFAEHLDWARQLVDTINVREEQVAPHADGVLKQVLQHLSSDLEVASARISI